MTTDTQSLKPQEAISILISRRARFVLFAKHLCRSQTLAEDIVQDAYVLAIKNIHQFSGSEPWKWMNTIIINRFRSIVRRECWYTDMEDVAEPALKESATNEIYVDQILKEIVNCPNGDLIVDLAMGNEYHELAEQRGIPEGTVKSRLFRARERLGLLLAESTT